MPYGNEHHAWTYEEYVDKYEALKQQRDDLLVKLESMICKGCNCSDCKIARATIAKAQPE